MGEPSTMKTGTRARLEASSPAILSVLLGLYAVTTLVSQAIMSVGLLFLLLATAVAFFSGRALKVPGKDAPAERETFRRFKAVSLLLFLFCMLSLVHAKLDPLQYAGKGVEVRFVQDVFKGWFLILPFWLLFLFRKAGAAEWARPLRYWLVAGGLISVVGIAQFYTGFPREQAIPGLERRYHAVLLLGHHLSVASILIFPFFVGLSLCTSRLAAKQLPLSRGLLAGLTLLMGTTLFLTWSRMLWLALPVGLAVLCLRRLRKKQAFAGVILIAIAAAGAFQLPVVKERLFNSMGTGERFELWRANWEFFQKRPLLGVGWRKPQSLTGYYFEEKYPADFKTRFVGHAHNNFLEMLGGVGLLGTLAWLLWNVMVLRLAFLASRKSKGAGSFWNEVAWGLFCAWVVFHLNGLTQTNFWEGKVMHQMMWSTGLILLAFHRKSQPAS